jgi:hypothetical protein
VAITTEREERLRHFMNAHCIDSHDVKTRARARNCENGREKRATLVALDLHAADWMSLKV